MASAPPEGSPQASLPGELPVARRYQATRFLAALPSRSCSIPHAGQIQVLTDSANDSSTLPQSEHVLLEAKKRGARTTFEPCHRLLYSSILRKSPHPASEMWRARRPFLTSPLTLRSSSTTTDLVFARRVLSFCRKSTLMFRIRRCSRASRTADRRRLLDPRALRLCVRDRRRSRLRQRPRGFGAATTSSPTPSEIVAKEWSPRSTPATGPAMGSGSGLSASTVSETYQRSASLRSVAERIRPSNFSVPSFVRIAPSRGNCTPRCRTRINPVSRKASSMPLRLKRGNP